MPRPLFLAILGVSIVASAVALGTSLTRYLSLRSYSPKAPAGTAGVVTEPGPAPPPVEEWQNPFSPSQGMNIPSRLPAAKVGVSVSRTNFILVGTIVSSTPSARRAILWAEGMKEPRAYRESEEVEPGAVLASVERDKAWLARGNEREKLDLLPVGSRARVPAAPLAAPGPSAAQAVPSPASSSPEVAPTALGPTGNEGGESARRGAWGIRRLEPASPPPVVGASPGPVEPGDDEERPRRSVRRRRR
jgi:Type II secretion system protein C